MESCAGAGWTCSDCLRNGRGYTAVGAYSPRARPGLPFSAPVTWDDLKRRISPDAGQPEAWAPGDAAHDVQLWLNGNAHDARSERLGSLANEVSPCQPSVR
jgi:DNA primase